MIDLSKILERCKKHERKAQKELYDVYSPILLGICIRYAKSKFEAEDVLQEGFIKILTKINDFKGDGSFEGWMKRIVVNTAISHYNKNKKHNEIYDIGDINETDIKGHTFESNNFTSEELFKVIDNLPEGYKVVFNLYAIEGYKHKEIAEMLNINQNTSKSQYSRAKERLRQKLDAISKIKAKNDTQE